MLFSQSRFSLALALGVIGLPVLTLEGQNVPASANTGPPPEIQYPQTPLRFILQDYETVSGKKIVKDQTILDIPISIETVHPIADRAEWLDFMERALLMNSVALVPVSDTLLKAVNWQSKAPGHEGVQTYSQEQDLPDGEVVVNYVMKLTYITTDEAARIFQEITKSSAGVPYVGMTEVPDANLIVISDNALIIKQLIELQKQIDVPPASVKTEVIQLLRADVETVSAAINDILNQQQQQRSSSTSPARRTSTPATSRNVSAPPGTGGAASAAPSPTGGPGASQPIVVYPDIRTNRLIVIARPLDVTYIQNLVKQLDAEVDIKRFINRQLSHVSVETVLPVLSEALLLQADPASTTGGGGLGGAGGLGGQNNRATGFGGQNNRGGNFNTGNTGGFGGNAGGFGGTGGAGGGGIGGASSGSIFGDQDVGPVSTSVGKSLIIADPKINTIIASGPPEDLRLINTILDEIDVKPRQVYLSTIIGQVTLGNNVNWGFDLLHRVQDYDVGGRTVRSGGLFQTGDGSNIIDLDSLAAVSDFPKVGGLSVYGQIGDYVNAYLRALESTNRFEVLSRPTIYIRNNRVGVISSGQAVAVPSSTQSSFTGGAGSTGLISNIQYRDVVLQLQVQPLINSDDEITLKIRQVNDDIIGSQNIQGTEVPTIGTQELETEVTVPNKSTIVLGGLITESRNDARDGLPILIHVPLLKHLFGENTKDVNRQELLIFIQPHIINNASDLVQANLEHTETNRVTRSAFEFGKKRADAGADAKAQEPAKLAKWPKFLSRRDRK